MAQKVAAVLTVKDPERMTKRNRQQIASWLRKQARHFVARGDRYAKNFRARYIYL
jgi:predicted PhzF superfamily epimerase YddE/YHI9